MFALPPAADVIHKNQTHLKENSQSEPGGGA